VIIGLLGKEQKRHEERQGFCIRRVPATLELASSFRDNFYLPLYGKLNPRGQYMAKTAYKIVASLLQWLDRKLRRVTVYIRLSKAMFAENAAYYHAHFPALLLFIAYLIAKLKRGRFVFDYNDVLVLEPGSYNQDCYYDQETLWGSELNEKEQARVEATIRLIPENVHSILDVGCGDGRLTNRLAGTYSRVVGAEISKEALQYVKTEAVIAAADALPFEDCSFDLVLSTELIEHLPDWVYQKAIIEMKRVAKQWILIGVPWKEQLTISQAKCIRCGTKFHINYHLRSFNAHRCKCLFLPEFALINCQQVGVKDRAYYSPIFLWVKRHLGGIWARTSTTICPNCGARLYPGKYPERNAISKLCDEHNQKIKQRKILEKSHVVCLYERR